jgi:hypothetical protein
MCMVRPRSCARLVRSPTRDKAEKWLRQCEKVLEVEARVFALKRSRGTNPSTGVQMPAGGERCARSLFCEPPQPD